MVWLAKLKESELTVRVNDNLLALIRAALAARNLKRKDFAASYNISPQYLSAMMLGKERWREEIQDQILTDLNLTERAKKMGLV